MKTEFLILARLILHCLMTSTYHDETSNMSFYLSIFKVIAIMFGDPQGICMQIVKSHAIRTSIPLQCTLLIIDASFFKDNSALRQDLGAN